MQQFLDAYICPSDFTADQLRQPWPSVSLLFAPGSYKAVSGIPAPEVQGTTMWWDRGGDNANRFVKLQEVMEYRGPIHAVDPRGSIKAEKIGKITDGTSRTLMVGEWMTATTEDTSQGHTYRVSWGIAYRSYTMGTMFREGVLRIADFEQCDTATGSGDFDCKRAFGSLHASGVINFVRCDGSVTAIQPEIDGVVYQALGTIQGQEIAQEI